MKENVFKNTTYDRLRFPLSEIERCDFSENKYFNFDGYFFDKKGEFIYHEDLLHSLDGFNEITETKEGLNGLKLVFSEFRDEFFFNSDFQRMGLEYSKLPNIEYRGDFFFIVDILFDKNGSIVSRFKWSLSDTWSSFENTLTNQERCIVENNKWNVNINNDYSNTNYAIADKYGSLVSDWYNFFSHSNEWIDDKYILAQKGDKYGILDYNGNVVVDFIYDWGNWDYERHSRYEKLRIFKGEKEQEYIGLFAWTGELIIDVKYKSLEIFSAFQEWFEDDSEREIAEKTDFVLLEDYEGNKYYWSFVFGLIQTHKIYDLAKKHDCSDYDSYHKDIYINNYLGETVIPDYTKQLLSIGK